MSYNITDNVDSDFDFKVENKTYIMSYPLMQDIESLQEIVEKQKEAESENDKVKMSEYGKQIQDFVYQFIRPEHGDQEDIKTVMKRQNIKVIKNFNIMIKTELGLE